jgi:hypothetical protein
MHIPMKFAAVWEGQDAQAVAVSTVDPAPAGGICDVRIARWLARSRAQKVSRVRPRLSGTPTGDQLPNCQLLGTNPANFLEAGSRPTPGLPTIQESDLRAI